MFEQLREHRILGVAVGLLLAATVGVLATVAGAPTPYPIVLALAVYVPVGAIVGSGERFDFDEYVENRGTRGVLLDVFLTAAAAFLGGTAVTVLFAAGLDGFFQIAAIALGAFIGGQVVFYARSYPFHWPDRDSAASDDS